MIQNQIEAGDVLFTSLPHMALITHMYVVITGVSLLLG